MKTVFNNRELCHIFVNQGQEYGRNQNSSMYFHGDMIYSYGSHYVLGKIYKIKDKTILLINNTSYSNTTGGHRNDLGHASRNHDKIEAFNVSNPLDIKESLNNKAGCIANVYFSLFSKRDISWIYKDFYDFYIKDHNYLCDLFNYPEFKIDYTSFDQALLEELNEYSEKRKAFFNTPEQIERKEKERAKREERKQAKLRAKLKEDIKDFRGGLSRSFYSLNEMYPQIIRIVDNGIETSGGARVDLKDAIKLYKALKSDIDVQGYKIGFYTVNELTKEYIKIGCHKIELNEIDNVLGKYLTDYTLSLVERD